MSDDRGREEFSFGDWVHVDDDLTIEGPFSGKKFPTRNAGRDGIVVGFIETASGPAVNVAFDPHTYTEDTHLGPATIECRHLTKIAVRSDQAAELATVEEFVRGVETELDRCKKINNAATWLYALDEIDTAYKQYRKAIAAHPAPPASGDER
jgi:hypothetical protein